MADQNTSAPANPGTSNSSSSDANPQTASTSDVLDVLHFDPFKGGSEIPAEGKDNKTSPKTEEPANANTGKGNENQQGKGNQPDPAAPANDPTKQAPAVPGVDQAQHWQQLAEHYKGMVEGKASPKTGATEEPGADAVPDYKFAVPEPLIDALTSEDRGTFKTGVTELLNGMAKGVHQQMRAEVSQVITNFQNSIPQMIQQYQMAANRNAEVAKDFYGTYPEFDHPQLKPVIMDLAKQVAKTLGKTAWDAQLRDEVARQAKAIFAVVSGQQTQQTRPAPMLPSQGARPAAQSNDPSRDIMDTLFDPT